MPFQHLPAINSSFRLFSSFIPGQSFAAIVRLKDVDLVPAELLPTAVSNLSLVRFLPSENHPSPTFLRPSPNLSAKNARSKAFEDFLRRPNAEPEPLEVDPLPLFSNIPESFIDAAVCAASRSPELLSSSPSDANETFARAVEFLVTCELSSSSNWLLFAAICRLPLSVDLLNPPALLMALLMATLVPLYSASRTTPKAPSLEYWREGKCVRIQYASYYEHTLNHASLALTRSLPLDRQTVAHLG